ncbi:MAG: ABC transporter ATP-binding protein [Oscillospiraceae bacterium]|nr:ABC transporter ATP-binding protein [Oscillospiraceae bacterium]
MNAPLLSVKDLQVTFRGDSGIVNAVRGVSFDIHDGEILGVVGESGSGKSATAYSIMGLLNSSGRVVGGAVEYRGENILGSPRSRWDELRGRRIGMIFQNPMACLDPMITVGKQLREAAQCHSGMSKAEADAAALSLLAKVGVADADRIVRQYSSALSGGMCQRVMIAMALIQKPELLIADEPTTSLDVTVQAQIIQLLDSLRKENNMAILFITHDMGLVAEICDSVCVMYAGRAVERGSVYDVFDSPAHPYTAGLMKAIPSVEAGTRSRLVSIEGVPVNLSGLPGGCPFHPRCTFCEEKCTRVPPDTVTVGEGHTCGCWYPLKGGL